MKDQRRPRNGIVLHAWRQAAAVAIVGALSAGTAWAQETVVIGGGGQPAVEVNLDVLRTLGTGGGQRVLRFPGETADQAVVLRPPGGAAAGQTARVPRPSLRPPAPSVTTRPAAARPTTQARAPAPTTVTQPAAPARQQPAASAPTPPRQPQTTTAVAPPPPPPPPAATARRDDGLESRRVAPPPAQQQESAPPAVREQTAALPPPNLPAQGQALQLLFEGSSTQLDDAAESRLRQLAGALNANEQRVQLKAFASGTSDRPSAARRESLSRALAVRSFLIENGVRSTRIDVRALGQPTDGGPTDRVDVLLLTQ